MVLKTQNDNVINKYRYLFPSFVYLRKMCHDKGSFIVKQKKCGLVIFFFSKTLSERKYFQKLLQVSMCLMDVFSFVWFNITGWHAMENFFAWIWLNYKTVLCFL